MDMRKVYSISDAENTEEHAEIVNGALVVENITTPRHNEAISIISTAIRNYISSNNGKCKVYTENVALYVNELACNDSDYYLPDVMVICDTDKIDDKGVHTVPLFVAEITSESTKRNDYNRKLDIYKKIGVDEYWIVDLQRNLVFKYLKNEDYIPQTIINPERVDVSVYKDLQVTLSEVM